MPILFKEREHVTLLQRYEISDLRRFLEEIANDQGFDSLDFPSWEAIGNAEIVNRVHT